MSDTAEKARPGLLRSSALVGSMTMMSRVLGLLRDIVIAAFVGASANADAFNVERMVSSLMLPNLVQDWFHYLKPCFAY